MKNLIDDLLQFTLAGSQKITLANIDLNEAIAASVKNLQLRIKESGARVIYQGLSTVVAPKTLMGELIQKLLRNAIKLKSADPPAIRIESVRTNGDWQFSVNDNGIGIDKTNAD